MDHSTQTPNDAPPLKLPKLRKGVSFAFNEYDKNGNPQWFIQDPSRNKFFIIGWAEYEMLERWTLGDGQKVVNSVNSETTLEVDLKDVENLIAFLTQNYLIQQSGYQIYKNAKEQKLFKNDNLFNLLISYYLFFRIPLLHPDNFLVRTKWVGDFLFSRTTGYIMMALGVIAMYQLSVRWETFLHTFPSVFSLQGLFFLFIAYLIIKLCHEMGHAYMCRRYGIPVPSLGVAFLVFWPVLYTDTTLSWSLNSHQRMRIALAGMWVETYVTIIAALLWCNVENSTLKSICFVTITVNWLASVLINISPFMRFDGYYVFADYLKMPNLQPRAFALTRWQIRHWLFHWADPPPEKFPPKMHYFLVAYSIFTWVYRLSIYFGIAILVYHFFIKIVGIILFAVELFVFILGPIVREIQTWILFKEKFSLNLRTKLTIFVTVLFCLLFFIPFDDSISFPGTLSYKHQFLIAPAEGILMSALPKVGTEVKAKEPIITLTSPELTHAIKEVQLEYQRKISEYRRASIDEEYASQKTILLSDISKQQAQYKKLLELYSQLILTVPFNGIVVEIASQIKPGTVISKDTWLGDVISPNVIQGEAFVSQIDVNHLKSGQEGYFYPHDLSESRVPVKVSSIEVVNSSKLNCQYATDVKQEKNSSIVVETPCYNASDLGGEIPTYQTEQGEYVPVDSVFRVLLHIEKPRKLTHVERGTIVITTNPHSQAYRFFYRLKTIFVQQNNL